MFPVFPFSFSSWPGLLSRHSKVARLFEQRAQTMCANDLFNARRIRCNWTANLREAINCNQFLMTSVSP